MSTVIFSGDVITPLDEEIQWNTLITPMESGKEQRRNKWTRPKRKWSWYMKSRSLQHMNYVWAFYNDRKGAYDSFYWENPNESPISLSGDEAVGVGDGATQTFSLDNYPVKSGDVTITVDGAPQTEASDYTVNYTTGLISFITPPPSGDVIVATSYRFFRVVRFEEDNISKELFAYQLYNANLKIAEVV